MTIYANREVSNRASERNNKRILYRFDGVARKNKEKLTTLVSLIISNKQRYYFDPCRVSHSSSIQPGYTRYNLDTTWIQPGYNLDTTWILLGYNLDTTWILLRSVSRIPLFFDECNHGFELERKRRCVVVRG